MNKTNEINDCIRQFIMIHFPLARKQPIIDDNSPLLNSRIIDSLGVFELILYIEKEFKITISDEDLLPENFDTIASLAALIQKKSNGNLVL